MLKPTYRDLTVILGLSIFSLICLCLPSLDQYPLNLVPTVLLLLFLPGYAILAAADPLFDRSSIIKRILLSVVVSLLVTLFLTLLSTYTPIKASSYIVIVVLTFILCIIALFSRRMFSQRLHSLTREEKKPAPKEKEPAKVEYEKIKPEKEEISEELLEEPAIEEEKEEELRGGEEKRSFADIIERVKLADKSHEDEPSRYQELTKPPRKGSVPPKKAPTPPEDAEPPEKQLTIPKRGVAYSDLILVVVLTVLCALFVLEPALNKTVIRTLLGLLLVLFLPGYALIAALFPKKDDLDSIERLALSFGLSIAVTPLIGLVLNYTPYGIRLDPILVSLSSITIILCAAAYLRRRKVPVENRFQVDFQGFFQGLSQSFKGESRVGKILSVVLIISIVLAVSTTAYIIVKPKEGERFTEFYILGPEGKASNYPTNLTPNQEGKLIIGIVNHEHNKTSYRLVVTSNGTLQDERTVTLEEGQKLEIPFNFTAGEPGERKMEFKLFKLPDHNNIYRSLHLWLNITSGANTTNR